MSSADLERHIRQTNDRLLTIQQSLRDPTSFAAAAKELLEWCSDPRAFQPHFEQNLITCARTVAHVATYEGFDLELACRLLSKCTSGADLLSKSSSQLLQQLSRNLNHELLNRSTPQQQRASDVAADPQPSSSPKTDLMWPAGGQPGVAIVTTVYPGASSTYQSGGYAANGAINSYPSPAYANGMAVGGGAKNGQQAGMQMGAGQMPYNIVADNPMESTPRSNMARAVARPLGPSAVAMNNVQIAAVAAATATATATAAIALDQSRHGHMQQHPPSYPPQQQVYYRQPHPGYMTQQQMAAQQQYAHMRSVQAAPPYYRAPHPNRVAGVPVARFAAEPPQYPGYAANGSSAGVTQLNGPFVQRSYSYPSNVVARPARQYNAPPHYDAPHDPQQYNHPAGMMASVPMRPRVPAASPQYGNGVAPPAEEPRVCLPGPIILPAFSLPHDVSQFDAAFEMDPKLYERLLSDPDWDLQLKCFHRDAPAQTTNWPTLVLDNAPNAAMPSVQVSVNGRPLRITAQYRPLYIKQFCQQHKNVITISVQQCCCSHQFALRAVSRQTISSLAQRCLQRVSRTAEQCKEWIRTQLLSQPTSPDVRLECTSVSLCCPLARTRMRVPARGAHCAHVQCFDLLSFLQVNHERHPMLCPLCNALIESLDMLFVDRYIMSIIEASPPDVSEVFLDGDGSWRLYSAPPEAVERSIKRENVGCDATLGNAPPLKRIKSEPQAWSHGNPASMSAVLSPAYGVASPTQRPATVGPPVKYEPPTPMTPSQMHNPPSVSAEPLAPSLVGQQQPPPPSLQQQTSLDCSSLGGSAPYTPASVGSAGSHAGQGSGGGNGTTPSGAAAAAGAVDPFDASDPFTADISADLLGDGNDLLSELDIRRYLDPTDLGPAGDFGLGDGASVNGALPSLFDDRPRDTAARPSAASDPFSGASTAGDLFSPFLD